MPQLFDLDRLRQLSWPKCVDWSPTLDSTNNRAKELAADADESVLVLTGEQTSGRGRAGNSWYSDRGTLTFSVMVPRKEMSIETPQLGKFSLATGVGVCRGLQSLAPASGDAFQLKWPNDVYLHGKKVCGVLTELTDVATSSLIVGIGINVNGELAGADEEIKRRATSLMLEWRVESSLTDVLVAVLQQLQLQWRVLQEDSSQLVAHWQQLCFLTGKHVELLVGNNRFRGICKEIDCDGALVIVNDRGNPERHYHGTVENVVDHLE